MTASVDPRRFGFVAKLDFARLAAPEVCRILSAEGYGAVSWTAAHFDPRRHDRAALARTIAATRDSGLDIAEIVAQVDAIVADDRRRADRIAHVEETIAAAAELGVGPVNIFTGPAVWQQGHARIPQDISLGTAWDMAIDAIGRYVRVASRLGVTLALEAVFGQVTHDYFTLAEMLRRHDAPALRVNLDPSHFFLARNDIPWSVRALGARIAHCHLKDAVGTPGMPGDQFLFPLLGEGAIDWAAFGGALDATGYRGKLTVEFESFAYYRRVLDSDPVRAARISREALDCLFRRPGPSALAS
jgi:sugar phosphate isomerase/epimerase